MVFDLRPGYHQVKMAKQDKEKAAFCYDQELWQFKDGEGTGWTLMENSVNVLR